MRGADIIAFFKTNKSEMKKYGVKKIGLFGSYAKDLESSNSDIDVLVEFKEGNKTFDNYMDLKFYLEKQFSRDVDLVINDNIKEDLKNEILESAIYA